MGPAGRSGYRSERLVDDVVAVLDAVLPDGGATHLVGHDWGSIQLWDAVAAETGDPRLRGRIASFTSVGGPSLDHAAWLARNLRGRRLEGTDHWGTGMPRDAAHGVNLYRTNVPRRLRAPRRLEVRVPVLVVHPRRDRFLTGVLTEDLDHGCSDVRVVEVDAGHWFPRTHPQDLAELVLGQVRAHP